MPNNVSNSATATGNEIYIKETTGFTTSHRLILLAYALAEHRPSDPVAWVTEVFAAYRAARDTGYCKQMSEGSAKVARSTFLTVARVKHPKLVADTLVDMAREGFLLPSSYVPAAFRYAGGDAKGEHRQATTRKMAEEAIRKAQADSVPTPRGTGDTGGTGDNAVASATVPASLKHLAAVISPADASVGEADRNPTLAAIEAARALLTITRESENKALHKALTGFLKRHKADTTADATADTTVGQPEA